MIHNFNWNKIFKVVLVSTLICISATTTFLQSIGLQAQENIDLDISLITVKANGTQVVEIEADGKKVNIEITKEQIVLAEKELSKLTESKQDSLEVAVEAFATESLPQWMVSLTIVTGYLSAAMKVWFYTMLGLCVRNLWKCGMTAWAIITGLNTADDMRRKIFG